jgi:hypothetical protein
MQRGKVANIIPPRKNFPRTSTAAYFAGQTVSKKKKGFIVIETRSTGWTPSP